MRYVLGSIAVATALHPSPTPAERFSARDLFAEASPSVVTIVTMDSNNAPLQTGSGVHLGGGSIITNCHVLAGSSEVIILHEGDKMTATELSASSLSSDTCILNTSLDIPSAQPGSSAHTEIGDRIYAIGAPRGLPLTLSDGLISGKFPLDMGELLQITAPISPGSSGGGLFDENGALIGITTLHLKDSQQLNFAIPIEWGMDLVNSGSGAMPISHLGREGNSVRNRQTELHSPWITRVELGTSTDDSHEIQAATEIFGIYDPIVIAFSNLGSEPSTTTVRWIYTHDTQEHLVSEKSAIVAAGSRVSFEAHNPHGWAAGTYTALVISQGEAVAEQEFCIQDGASKCRKEVGIMYVYEGDDGTTHYSAERPATTLDFRTINYSTWTFERRN